MSKQKEKPWVKLSADEVIRMLANGWTVRDIGVWITLKSLVTQGTLYDIDVIGYASNVGIHDSGYARILSIGVRQWRRYKDIFVRSGLITVGVKNTIKLNKYTKQKPVKLTSMTTAKADMNDRLDTDTYTDANKHPKISAKAQALLNEAGVSFPDETDASDIEPF